MNVLHKIMINKTGHTLISSNDFLLGILSEGSLNHLVDWFNFLRLKQVALE